MRLWDRIGVLSRRGRPNPPADEVPEQDERFTTIRTFKYRLYPSATQRSALLRARRLPLGHNQAKPAKRHGRAAESLSRYDTIKLIPGWKAEQPFLNDAAVASRGVHAR